MLQGLIDLWFVIVAISLVVTTYHVRTMPISWVQKLGWILVVAYTGPFGMLLYFLTCGSPKGTDHATYTAATWKQAVNSEVHCVAGDATGIIFAAAILSYATIPMSLELLIEYMSAFMFGWVIFQAGMMRSMFNSYAEALKNTLFAESLSMNFVMIGMIPVMVLLMRALEHGRDPSSTHFWFSMGMATIVGSIIAYPANYWLVKNKLKHGCMTLNMDMKNMTTEHDVKTISKRDQLRIVGLTFAILVIVTVISLVVS